MTWGGLETYAFEVEFDSAEAVETTEAESNDDSGSAQALSSVPVVVRGASLDGATDEDWFAVDVGASDVGSALRIWTQAGDPGTDTVVDVFEADGVTEIGSSGDSGFHESLLTGSIAASGTYYVRVTASPDFFDPDRETYELAVSFE